MKAPGNVDTLIPFGIAAGSIAVAEVHAWAALLLTVLGIAYTGRKLWLSFRTKNTEDR